MRLLTESSSRFASGVNDSAAPDEYRPDQVQVLVNARVSPGGNSLETVRAPVGIDMPYTASGASVFGLIGFTTAAGVDQLVGFFEARMFYSTDGGLTWTQAATGLTEAYWSFAIYREGSSNVLVCANGGTNTYQWDGTTWGTVSNIPNNVKYVAVFGDRLIASGHSGVDVVASNVGDIDTWSNGWTVKATTHDGDTEVTGLFVLGSSLMVFKRKSVGFIEGFGYQTLQVATGARGISRSTGCVAFRTIAPVGDDGVMWLSERGFEFFQVGSRIQLASANQTAFVDHISYSIINAHPGIPCAVWWPDKREYICSLPVGNGLGADGVGNTFNTWLWCFRQGTEIAPPSVYMVYPPRGSGFGLEVDDDGLLDLVVTGFPLTTDADGNPIEDPARNAETAHMGFVDKQGYLDICRMPEPGLEVTLEGITSLLQFADDYLVSDRRAPVSLAVADMGEVSSVLFAGMPNLGVAVWEGSGIFPPDPEFELGGQPMLQYQIRTRPMVFGDEFTRKKAKRAVVLAEQAVAATVEAYVIVDGAYSTRQNMTFAATSGLESQEQRIRVGGRGRQIQVELHGSSAVPQKVRGISVDAAPMRDQV